MTRQRQQDLEDAINSMLRTDYIPLNDTDKLNKLAKYYVDYMGYMKDIVGPTDQLIVGRRGTGKTTLLYRSLVECMRSWGSEDTAARPRTLGVYLDLEKCQSLTSSNVGEFSSFEYAFVNELCDAIKEELYRSWPKLAADPTLVDRVFKAGQAKQNAAVNENLRKLSQVLSSGLPRFVERTSPIERKQTRSTTSSNEASVKASASTAGPEISGGLGEANSTSEESETKSTETVHYQLSVADLLRVISDLRKTAEIPYFIIFVDEFSSLSEDLQRRFTTLLKKILGNHAGVYVKLCAITDNYNLGSSIILQRDLFELSLDLDAFVERSGSLRSAMEQLERLTEAIIIQRIAAYITDGDLRIFDAPDDAYRELSRSAMGVPRTIGIVLKQAWSRANGNSSAKSALRIRKRDLDYGIRYASKGYYNQMVGAARNGLAIPAYVPEIWESLLTRASAERTSNRESPASHFMLTPRNEERIRYLNMFFLVHLLEQGRTTKKESLNRSLYSFDYGVTEENNLGWGDNKDLIRQQRFAYDSELTAFDRHFTSAHSAKFRCLTCSETYEEQEITLNGKVLKFCPNDGKELEPIETASGALSFTEEEIKIIGAIRSANREDDLIARQVADDVGCYVQKVSKFGAKLDRDGVISRSTLADENKRTYFDRS